MNIPLSSTLLVIVSINFSGWLLLPVGSSHVCPHQCICYEHADLVDCRNGKFEHVPRGLPHGTWLLKLGGNNLSIIETRTFIGLWSLRVLVLTNSHIKEIQAQVGRKRWKNNGKNISWELTEIHLIEKWICLSLGWHNFPQTGWVCHDHARISVLDNGWMDSMGLLQKVHGIMKMKII